jgi:hypothetical protein
MIIKSVVLAAAGMTCALSACSSTNRGTVSGPSTEKSACSDASAWQDELRTAAARFAPKIEPQYMWDTCAGVAQVTEDEAHLARRPGDTV